MTETPIHYPDPPWIVPLRATKRLYRTVMPFVYEWQDERGRYQLRIPKGFQYDGASVPRLLWSLTGLLPDGLIRSAALVHDVFYRFDGCPPLGWLYEYMAGEWYEAKRGFDRAYVDRLFRDIGKADGEKRAGWAYRGVRIGARRWKPQCEGTR